MTEPAAVFDKRPPRRLTPFLPTRQHRRFAEFADAVRRHRYWEELGFSYDSHRSSDAESVVTIVRITGGDFRLIERLMSQVARIMKINKLDTITPDAIEAAREVLVVGA